MLGHKNMKTTTNFYAGPDTRRAARRTRTGHEVERGGRRASSSPTAAASTTEGGLTVYA